MSWRRRKRSWAFNDYLLFLCEQLGLLHYGHVFQSRFWPKCRSLVNFCIGLDLFWIIDGCCWLIVFNNKWLVLNLKFL